jgi:mRNA interferase RelE/StbE
MNWQIEVGSKAAAQLESLDSVIGASVERKILWLCENADVMVHRRLVGMPDDLAGLCKLRIGDYRILYWPYPAKRLIRIYSVQHRSQVYRQL